MYLFTKRLTDIILSSLGAIILSPLILILALAVKCTSPGPIFFRQRRLGIGKKPFTMLKYRTMRADTPPDVPTHLMRDPYAYITKIGVFLRKTSLDELPQLWNIFVGDMSLVGPRPALWNQDDLAEERDKYGANDIRPGLTGLAQIRGRDELPIEQKAACDGEYRAKMCAALDWHIMWRTLWQAISAKGVSEGGPGA